MADRQFADEFQDDDGFEFDQIGRPSNNAGGYELPLLLTLGASTLELGLVLLLKRADERATKTHTLSHDGAAYERVSWRHSGTKRPAAPRVGGANKKPRGAAAAEAAAPAAEPVEKAAAAASSHEGGANGTAAGAEAMASSAPNSANMSSSAMTARARVRRQTL